MSTQSDTEDNNEDKIESFDEIEQELKDTGWMPDDVFEPVTSDWNNSKNDSLSEDD